MAIEPLSLTTKKSKISLLTFSLAFFLVNIFEVKMTSIPTIGVQFKFSEYLLPWFLVLGMFYNLICFLIYYKDDMHNPVKRRYQSNFDTGVNEFESKLIRFANDVLRGEKWTQSDILRFVEIMKTIAIAYGKPPVIEIHTPEEIVETELNKISEDERKRLFDPTYRNYIIDFIRKHGENFYQIMIQKEPRSDVRIAKLRNFLDFTFPILFFCVSLLSILKQSIK
ncbi:hypothetical protein [Reichenbachiella sp.]|uniref:hypothetical protein n=1 Tax=Reichenbachiella sp. TaxID=2184521 RepID=UPI003BB1093E